MNIQVLRQYNTHTSTGLQVISCSVVTKSSMFTYPELFAKSAGIGSENTKTFGARLNSLKNYTTIFFK